MKISTGSIINVFKISLPQLSERKEDIPLLADTFMEQLNQQKGRTVSGISRKAMSALMLHNWPGNVRELENAVEHELGIDKNTLRRKMIRLEIES